MSDVKVRVGIVYPTGGTMPFWRAHAPEGVELLWRYLGYQVGDRETFWAGFKRAEELAAELKTQGCQIILVGGTPPALLAGLDFERKWRDDLSAALGLPVLSQMEAHALALQAIGARRVAMATYYGDELNQAIVTYLARFGIEGVPLGGFNLTGEGEALFTTPMQIQHGISEEQVYDYIRQGLERLGGRFDAIYINGGGWHTASRLFERLERDFQTSVVWGPAADMWLLYWKLGMPFTAPDAGALFRDLHQPIATTG
jgi:maleate cis-trans isomerase